VRTPTLPPATHTNTYVVGEGALTVLDPASPYEDERQRLADALQARVDAGERVERIVLTHHHDDHVSGAEALRARFPAPIAAHPITAGLVSGSIAVDEPWNHGEARDCGGRRLVATFTPGHAPGHLVFQDDDGAMIAGDMVAGVGTILIAPQDGDLGQYLASLQAMRDLAPTVLLPAHGEPLPHADALLAFYIAHRHQRTEQIRQALDRHGTSTALELAPRVYPELPAEAMPIAAAQITSHLRWMARHGLARPDGDRWST
jgi:glyoxylase-like metal-dependent hydrolase (beta-lactamase superfamily II)